MNADDVIDSYVRDVAQHLPRRKRNDVAFELRALLGDELAGKAEAADRTPDKAMAMDLLKGFGRPTEVARRYHEPSAVIDAADTHHFIIWSVGGAVALGILSLLGPAGTVDDGLFLQWLGVLVIFFAFAGWWRRRNPDAFGWRPKRGPDWMPRGLALLAMTAILAFPVFMYAAPRTFVETLFLGAVPTSGIELTEAFRGSWQRAATLALLMTLAALHAAVTARGQWRPWMHWTSITASFCLGLLFLAHAAPMATTLNGERFAIFASPTANGLAMPIFGAVGAMMLLFAIYYAWREWARIRPAPAPANGPAL